MSRSCNRTMPLGKSNVSIRLRVRFALFPKRRFLKRDCELTVGLRRKMPFSACSCKEKPHYATFAKRTVRSGERDRQQTQGRSPSRQAAARWRADARLVFDPVHQHLHGNRGRGVAGRSCRASPRGHQGAHLGTEIQVLIDGRSAIGLPVSTASKGYVTPPGTFQPTRMHRIRGCNGRGTPASEATPRPHSVFFIAANAVHGTVAIRRLGPVPHGCIGAVPTRWSRRPAQSAGAGRAPPRIAAAAALDDESASVIWVTDTVLPQSGPADFLDGGSIQARKTHR